MQENKRTGLMPTLHKHVPMGSRVKLSKVYHLPSKVGTVVGIASMHVIFTLTVNWY